MSTSVSSVVSHFPSAENGFTTTLSSTISAGATTVGLNSLSGYTTGEVAVFVVAPSVTSEKQVFTGIVDTAGLQLTSVVWTSGTNQTHNAGTTVVDYATATHISMISKGLLVSHDQDGTLKAGAVDGAAVLASDVVTTAKVLDSNITTAKIADNNVTAAKLATDAIKLGYTAHNADTTTSGTSDTEITGVATTVTIPSGGRSVLVTFHGTIQNSASANCYVTLWDGAVGSGTVLAESIVGLSLLMPISLSAVVTPAAGSKTYRVSMKTAAGTCSMRGANPPTAGGNPGNPYILVTAI